MGFVKCCAATDKISTEIACCAFPLWEPSFLWI